MQSPVAVRFFSKTSNILYPTGVTGKPLVALLYLQSPPDIVYVPSGTVVSGQNDTSLTPDVDEDTCAATETVYYGSRSNSGAVFGQTQKKYHAPVVNLDIRWCRIQAYPPAHNIEFFTEDGKLHARITDYSKQTYELKVSCKYLRDIFEKGKDVENLNNAVAASQYAHCRIGLARKFLMQENHCYLMLNGLFLY